VRSGVSSRGLTILQAKGWLTMGRPIVDATMIEARRPRLTRTEKDTLKGGSTPPIGKSARRAQTRDTAALGPQRQPEIAVPMFGYETAQKALFCETELDDRGASTKVAWLAVRIYETRMAPGQS
jgi:hypothetical protein